MQKKLYHFSVAVARDLLTFTLVYCIFYKHSQEVPTPAKETAVQLTQEIAARYEGGQIEVQNQSERYLYRGEIATIAVEGEGDDATLTVTLGWKAKGEGFPPFPHRWVNDVDNTAYRAGLRSYAVGDIDDGRICLTSMSTGETAVLYPPGGSKLDPSRVEGLAQVSG